MRTHFQAWQLSQFLHGEQGALVCTAKIVQQVPTIDAKFLRRDPGRRRSAPRRGLRAPPARQVRSRVPINPHLKQLLDDTLADSRWDFTYLGMQVLIEGVALAAFGMIRDQATNPLAQSVTAYVMQDEARHVAFGRLALRDYYPQLTEKERDEREEFIVEGCYLLRDRFLAEEVWETLGLPVEDCKRYTDQSETHALGIAEVVGREAGGREDARGAAAAGHDGLEQSRRRSGTHAGRRHGSGMSAVRPLVAAWVKRADAAPPCDAARALSMRRTRFRRGARAFDAAHALGALDSRTAPWHSSPAAIVASHRPIDPRRTAMSTTEQESRQIAEQARETEWEGRTFLRELFLGKLSLPLIHPFPMAAAERPEFTRFYQAMETFLRDQVDSAAIDQTGEYPEHVIDGLRKLGAFGMKIPTEYGGLGFTVSEYCKVMQLIGSTDNNVSALLSAHQSIGVPQPLKLFGTPEQKKKYLPRCAAGAISAFALTEPHVGSDPASLSTTARRDGDDFILNGEKLWCTDGTLAELLVVMARDPQTKKISAFVVETDWPGVKIEYRCRFMGLKALANGVISFRDVRVPRENLIGDEGKGLRIALTTLNTGRLTLPAVCAGIAKQCLRIVRGWSNTRQQWGLPIWKHEAVGHMIADMAATTFAMDSIWMLASQMADRGGYDIRLEAAAAKEWNTVRAWEIVDKTLQLRGGRGYETESSLQGRGEHPIPVERMMRDCRINLIFEGSSEIMHLFMAREAVDKHLQVAGAMIDPKNGNREKASALPGILGFYAKWYPPLWLKGLGGSSDALGWGTLGPHLRFVERSARKLARESFHGMAVFQAKMERKQGFLFRTVDIVMELFAMSATLCRARRMYDDHHPEAEHALELADLFCRSSRRKVNRLFRDLWSNDDDLKNKVVANVMGGKQAWLEEGIMDIGLTEAAFQTRSLVEHRSRLAAGEAAGAAG